jgi:hypothetical protein
MENASLIDIASLLLKKQFVFPIASILGLGLFTYLTKRYLNTEKQTTNQYYIKTDESPTGLWHKGSAPYEHTRTTPNLTLTTQSGLNNIIYVFWNGDLNSTYLVIDLLLQDKIVQPLYIERYTIIKSLEYDNLESLTKKYSLIKNKNTSEAITSINQKIKQYLEDVARIKRSQNNEISQITLFRKMIIMQYPEFQQNFLPTQYITTITKDLKHTSDFFNILKDTNPLYYNGIEFLEQALRFTKHFTKQKTNSSPRILIGYSRDSKNIDLVKKILARIGNKLELPLQDINNQDVSYLAVNFFPNDIMQYFKSK